MAVGGLASSPVLIISAIPALYFAFSRLGWALRRSWARLRRHVIQPLTARPARQA